MTSLKSISLAIESIDSKKENLRKSFEDLQSHPSSLSSFTLQWKDLEEHFDSTKKFIDGRFKELESKAKKHSDGYVEKQQQKQHFSSPAAVAKPVSNLHPEMKTFCTKMDGIGLRAYILKHRKELVSIRDELCAALRSASNPAKMVLDAMEGYYPANAKGDRDGEMGALRITCRLLLEKLLKISPQINPDIKEKAQKLSMEWKRKVSSGDKNPLEPLGLLQLLATYGLVSFFGVDEVLDLAVTIARRNQAVELIHSLGITDKVPDFIQKLISKGKQLDAVKFAYAFELVDKFPPVPLLKDYFKESKKVAQENRSKGGYSNQSLNEAITKELAAVKGIIKCLEEHNLESQYPRGVLDKCVEQLEKQKASMKRPANAPTPDKKQQENSGNKRPRPAVNVSSATTSNAHMQQPVSGLGSAMDRFPSSYLSSSDQYRLAGTSPSISSYMNPATGPHGLGSNPNSVSAFGLGLGGKPTSPYGMNLSPPRSLLYPSESQLTIGLHDRLVNYGGLGMPPSHRSIYNP